MYLVFYKYSKKMCRIYFETIFTQKCLVNFTNNYKVMDSNTELNMTFYKKKDTDKQE